MILFKQIELEEKKRDSSLLHLLQSEVPRVCVTKYNHCHLYFTKPGLDIYTFQINVYVLIISHKINMGSYSNIHEFHLIYQKRIVF